MPTVALIAMLLLTTHFSTIDADAKCDERSTCSECMRHAECFWCLDHLNNPSPEGKCSSSLQESSICSERYSPSSQTEVVEDAPLNPGSELNIVQISPQKVTVHIRPGDQGHRVPFSIAQSKQYPLDLYFLLDLSWSMNKSRNNFAEQGGAIIDGIKTITQNLHTGIGSFVEKNLAPFTSAIPSFNCPKENPHCQPPYSFYHRTMLSELAAEQFRAEVLDAPLAGNVDEPEGSLDGLLQAMTCWDRVGWRDKARKIILLATDRDFHYAMDGKLVGILERNDGECYLNGTAGRPGFYTRSNELDYPSISQINSIAQKNSFVLIFAVIPQYRAIWESMAKLIQGSFVEILETDAANIVQIIEERYKDITSTIKPNFDNVPEDVFVKLKSKCTTTIESEVEACPDVELGTTVEFIAEISVRKCLESPKFFTISPAGLNQTLVVEVNTICDCACEHPGHGSFAPNSSICHFQGDNACGVCACADGFSGQTCECESSTFSSDPDAPKADCRDPDNSGTICNGLGTCQCNACVCANPTKNYGKYCQCDDTTCIRDTDNALCFGNGNCECGECICAPGWSGKSCDCFDSDFECLSPYTNNLICSGNGKCLCNKCKCDENGEGLFSGKFCEKFPSELSPCKVLQACVECLAFNSGPLAKSGCLGCDFQYAEISPENMTLELQEIKPCQFWNDAGCKFFFTSSLIASDEVAVFVHVLENEKEFCPKVNTLAISFGLFAALLLLGLLILLIWKCYFVIDDRRIYAKFERETQELLYATNENPNDIYKSPITEYKNPMYGKAVN